MKKGRSADKRSSKKSLRKSDVSSGVTLIIGRQRFAKISAVEGISLTGRMKDRVAEFDRRGSSAEERRMTIIQAYRKS